MQRANIGYNSGILTLNQALEIVNLPNETEGDIRKDSKGIADNGELPRENGQEGTPTDETTDDETIEDDSNADNE